MHRIIMDWMVPRSLTTVFMRSIESRKDLRTVFEPFLPLYWSKRASEKGVSHRDYEGWPTRLYRHKGQDLRNGRERPLFIKECALHAVDQFVEDKDLLENCFHMFQIRHPKRCVLSSWKLRGTQKRQLADSGFDASYKIFKRLSELNLHPLGNGQTPLVIDGDDFQEDPEGIMRAWCDAVGLDFKPEAMSWQPEWRKDTTTGRRVITMSRRARAFRRTWRAFLYDELLHKAIFEDLPLLKVCYEYHLPYYEEMHKFRLMSGTAPKGGILTGRRPPPGCYR